MRTRPLISNSVTTGLIDAITAAGGDPGQVQRSIKFDFAALSDAEGFIACADFSRLLEEIARATGDDCFGLHFGARSNPKHSGPLIYAVINSPTIAAACDTAARYLHVHNQALKVSLKVDDKLAYFAYAYSNLGMEKPRQFSEFSMAGALNTFRIMAGSQWTPREVQFAHNAPDSVTEHLRDFRRAGYFSVRRQCARNGKQISRPNDTCRGPSIVHHYEPLS